MDNTFSFLPWLVGAVLMFWSVGAYNRLVRLRNAILRRFVPVDQHLESCSSLLEQQVQAWAQRPEVPRRDLDTLQAARAQADAARLAAKRQPGAADAIRSLRVALQILAQSRERAGVGASAEAPNPRLLQELTACDHALHYAQGQFNDAVREYNRALAQFPAAWLGALFGFRSAGVFGEDEPDSPRRAGAMTP
ncbi:MAG: LemA family protein [Burkholderiaceae bacterium]